jgi:ribosomal-protein-alanine N-acetyltransferase
MSPPIAVPEEIVTRRLRLRRHHEGDVEAFQGFMTDPEATRYLPLDDDERTPAGARAMLLNVAELYDSEAPVFSLTITLLGVDRYLGSCGLSPTDEDDVVEIYFALVPAAQGHGYATEAVEALIGFTRSHGVRRLVARVFDGNRPSIGVLERSGFTLAAAIEGELGPASLFALDL